MRYKCPKDKTRSDAAKARWASMSLEARAALVKNANDWTRGTTRSPETRAKMAEAQTRRMADPAFREALRKGCRKRAEDPAYREKLSITHKTSSKCAAGRLRVLKQKGQTPIEKAVAAKLTEANIAFESQFPIGRYVADFCLVEQKVVIEADGDYWHSKPDVKARDTRKDIFLAESGYRVWRFPECDIKSGRAFLHPVFRPAAQEAP